MLTLMKNFPRAFYVANTMEIFERLAWYGFFSLSSLYMTTPIEHGGVGFTDAQRGALQGIIPFFLYLLPVITGAIADRYGYRKMFLISFAIMAPSYYLLGQTTSFTGFFLAFSAVALGAACFKPIVVGTISHSTNDENRGLGFGIFYTMVNIGGFIGPLVAGYMRAISWDAVFMMSAGWILVNFIPALFFFKAPLSETKKEESFATTLKQAQQVLGNGRLALTVFPCIAAFMFAGAAWVSYQAAFFFIAIWLVVNWLWNKAVGNDAKCWYKQKAVVSNVPFAMYLLILTGFWAVYNQLFYTMPLFIRDFVDTQDLVQMLAPLGEGIISFLAFVNEPALAEKIIELSKQPIPPSQVAAELIHLKVRVPEDVVISAFSQLGPAVTAEQAASLASLWASQYRQINPEYIINLDFAAIIFCQIAVSYICQRFKSINVLVAGTVIFSIACFIALFANSLALGGAFITIVVLMMAFGEMVTSPKSQEYVASIAPKSQSALYMGYYFVSMALGFLFAGLLSGWGYGELAKNMNRPDLMWTLFATIGLITAVGLMWFNRKYVANAKFTSTQPVQTQSV